MYGTRRRASVARRTVVGLALVSAMALVAGCWPDEGREPTLPTDLMATLDTRIENLMDAGLIPGVVIAIGDQQRYGTVTRAYGVSDVASGRPADAGDHFRIASITKTFTATAVLRLVDEGRLKLDDRLEQFVAGVPNGADITIADLLGMRAGVSDLTVDEDFRTQLLPAAPGREWSAGDTLRVITDNPDRAKPPRTETVYSNSEYYLLGLVLEKVTGKPLSAVLDELADDHGLTETSYPADAAVPAPVVHGYSYDDDVLTDMTLRTPPTLFGAAGSMVSTVADLVRYAPLVANGDLLKPETLSLRTQFTELAGGAGRYGLGLQQLGKWLGHTGSVAGYTTIMTYLPDREVSVVVAVNRNTLPVDAIKVDAIAIWAAVVQTLYKDVTQTSTPDPVEPNPAVPSVTELDALYQQALDPNVPASSKALRIVGDEQDPELITKVAQAYAAGQFVEHIDKVTEVQDGLIATTTAVYPGGRIPATVQFTVQDGTWRLGTAWACQAIADNSPACA